MFKILTKDDIINLVILVNFIKLNYGNLKISYF